MWTMNMDLFQYCLNEVEIYKCEETGSVAREPWSTYIQNSTITQQSKRKQQDKVKNTSSLWLYWYKICRELFDTSDQHIIYHMLSIAVCCVCQVLKEKNRFWSCTFPTLHTHYIHTRKQSTQYLHKRFNLIITANLVTV